MLTIQSIYETICQVHLHTRVGIYFFVNIVIIICIFFNKTIKFYYPPYQKTLIKCIPLRYKNNYNHFHSAMANYKKKKNYHLL